MTTILRDAAELPAPMDTAPRRSLDAFVVDSGLESVVLGASKDPNAKVTILLVSPATKRAVYAIKVPTTAGAECAVEAEAAVLAALPCDVPVAMTFPEVVEMLEHRGRAALVTTALVGTPMTRVYLRRRHTASRDRVARDFAMAAGWLRALQDATADGHGPIDFDGDVATRLSTRFAKDPAILGDLARLDGILGRLGQELVPRTAVHGDFWFGNLLVDGDRLAVVDWEASETSGDPVRDLVRFVISYALYLDRTTPAGRRVHGHDGLVAGEWGGALEWALEAHGWFGELFRGFVRDGLERLGASPAAWRDAVLAGIAEVAAVTDDEEFARHHLELFRRLSQHAGVVR